MPTIAIFGGTGMTGQCAVEHALQKGNDFHRLERENSSYFRQFFTAGLIVRMLYRNAETIPAALKDRQGLQPVQGDALNVADVERTLEGVDGGVVIILGTRNVLTPTTAMSTGTLNIIAAMRKAAIRRLTVCLSSFLLWPTEKVPPMMANINAEHKTMLELVKAAAVDLDYVAVLPPHISGDQPAGTATVEHDVSPGRIVSKVDLAGFLVDALEQSEHYGRICGIALKA